MNVSFGRWYHPSTVSGKLNAMRSRRLAVLFALLAGCQEGSDAKPGPSAAYKKDVARICDVETLAGVAERPDENPQFVTAMWLGENLETTEARDFLATLGPLPPAEKANLLRSEARRAGLSGCALAASWK
jgi:hypothetical protein